MAIATPNNVGGYEYTFVEPPPDFCICKICHFPSKDPYMTGQCCQGQTICKSCLDQWKEINQSTICPACGTDFKGKSNADDFKVNRNYVVERMVKGLKVYCTNKEKGCKWQGELMNINNHLGNSNGCEFEEVKCSNECGKMIQRRYLTAHVEVECPRRKVNCEYCHDTGEHQFIEGQHKEKCPKLPLPCPNKCVVGSVPREDMEAHRKKCPLEMIQCEYYSVGCEVRMARKDQEKHKKENMEEHLMKTQCKLTDTTNQLVNALQRISTLEALVHLTIDKAVTSTTEFESSLRWSVKLAAMAMMSKSGNQVCPAIFKMPGFDEMKKNDVICHSDSFYTNDKGYKMHMDAYPAGCDIGNGTHLSCYLVLMKGPHDDNLSWPLKDKFEIKLLNQISDSQHHSMTVNYEKSSHECKGRVTEGDKATGYGRHQFIINEDLYKINSTFQYLKDDCLFFQITEL